MEVVKNENDKSVKKEKMSYEELENIAHQLSEQSRVLMQKLQEANMSNMFMYCNKLKNIEMTNFGKSSGLTGSVDFSNTIWGSGTTAEEIAVNTQSIRDTLITNSYDRATDGYSVLTITLSTYTKGLLTTTETAQITVKGYTIA